jgi:hypothetical protein
MINVISVKVHGELLDTNAFFRGKNVFWVVSGEIQLFSELLVIRQTSRQVARIQARIGSTHSVLTLFLKGYRRPVLAHQHLFGQNTVAIGAS